MWWRGVRSGEQGAEVGVGADEHPALRAGFVDDDGVGGAAHADVATCTTSWPALREVRELRGEVVVEQEPHAEWRSGSVAYEMFRWACATYLLGLGVDAILAARKPRAGARTESNREARGTTLGLGVSAALLTCALNPKLGVFFVVFLPHFIPAAAPVEATSLALAAVQAGEAVLWYLLLSRLASGATRVLARQRVRAWLDRITAAVFIGFGLRIAAEG